MLKLKISHSEEPKHTDCVCCVGWNTAEEVYSCGDDHIIFKWNLITKEATKIADLPPELRVTDCHWFPRGYVARSKQDCDVLLVTAVDGKFYLLNEKGRFEKTIGAHKAAVLTGRWSCDGCSILTGSEDGEIKIWSRNGILRSTIVNIDAPIYSAVWGPDSNQVLYTHGKALAILHLGHMTGTFKWKAHDGVILKVSWSYSNNLIVSGGEDCRYKVWDAHGRQLFTSGLHDYPIRAIAWSPNGDLFAVGSYNSIQLCDKTGWSYSLETANSGTISSVAWSSDGTKVAAACAGGHVLFGHIIQRRLQWRDLAVSAVGLKTITVQDVLHNTLEKLEFPDCVIKVALGYRHLVIATLRQCHIYSTGNWNTPIIFDLREGSVSMLLLSERHFLIVKKYGLSLFSYEGHLIGSPKWPSMQPEILNPAHVTISPETIAVRDQVDEKLVHLFKLGTACTLMELPSMKHNEGVTEVALNQAGNSAERQLAFLDKNRDLFLRNIAGSVLMKKLSKLATMVHSFIWNNESNILAAIQDTNMVVWYYPNVVFTDKRLTNKTTFQKDVREFGQSPVISSFDGSLLSMRRVDGSLAYVSVSAYPAILHGYSASSCWEDAVRLCRSEKDHTLWACLAAIAIHANKLSIAEEAYAEIDELDKVAYIQRVKAIPIPAAQVAEMALLVGNAKDAEGILLQNGLVFRAIMSNLNMHNWSRRRHG